MTIRSSVPVSSAEYERLALADPEGNLELHRGRLRRKPGMTMDHNFVAFQLGHLIASRLDRRAYHVRVNAGRTRRRSGSYYIPDVMVIPASLARELKGQPDRLESYEQPLPFIAEVWSPSTGGYDATEKLDEYRSRGDHEIWLVHPYDQTVTVWRRHEATPGYTEAQYSVDAHVSIGSLPGLSSALRSYSTSNSRRYSGR